MCSAGPSPVGGMTAMRNHTTLFHQRIKVCAGYHIRRQNYAERGVPSLFASPPSLYFSRVARIFEEADLTLPEIKKMALETASQERTHSSTFR